MDTRAPEPRAPDADDALPVVVPTPTVDLSRLDASLVAQISSFIRTSLELLNLALTCKSFGWPRSTGTDLSLAEEVAQQVVRSGGNGIEGVRITLPQYVRNTTTWLSILHESENPMKFDTLFKQQGGQRKTIVEHQNGRRTVRCSGVCTAVANNFVMTAGIHYTDFHMAAGTPYLGIVRPMPNLDRSRFGNRFSFYNDSFNNDFLAARTDEWGSGNVHVCRYDPDDGSMSWTSWDYERQLGEVWEGGDTCGSGDTVGLLLNLDDGTLTVYKNNRRLGVMKYGLSGSYCWWAFLVGDTTTTIERCEPPRA